MSSFVKLPHHQRASAGLEWRLFRRLPLLMTLGTIPLAVAYVLPYVTPITQSAHVQMLQFLAAGIALTTTLATLVLGLASAIVIVMKGPGFVRDPYRLPDTES